MTTMQLGEHKVFPRVGHYTNGRIAIQCVIAEGDGIGEVARVATVNVPEERQKEGEIFLKDWAENAGTVDAFVREGYVEPPHRKLANGFVEVDVCLLTEKGIRMIANAPRI